MRAHHVERYARPGDEAAIELLTEAAAAANGSAPATAARWYEATLRLVPYADAARRTDLQAAHALALAGAGRVQEGRDALVEVLAASPGRLELVAACAGLEKLLGRPVDARRRLLKAFAAAPAELRPALALQLASVETCFGSPADIRKWAAHAAATEDPVLLGAAEAAEALGALRDHDPVPAHKARERAAARLHAAEDADLARKLDAAVLLGLAELATERFADAATTAERALAIARRTGQARLLVSLSVIAALAHVELLELDKAAREIDDAAEAARLQDVPHVQLLVLRARMPLHELRGEGAEAARAADEVTELLQSMPESYSTLTGRALAAALTAERDPERGLDELAPLLDHADPR